MKNVCQTCLFDVDFGLPIEIRDKYLSELDKIEIPKDEVNKDYWANQTTQLIDKIDTKY